MQITDELLDRITALAKLELSGEERNMLKGDFQQMLDFVDKLQEVETEGVEPLIHITEEVNRLREDEPSGALSREAGLAHAPDADGTYFRVPKVLDK
jgi:aspartyl-tRNA(Asn)/glutamyl-tRNA(Gln) amidotransferase subunit C